MKEIVLPDNRQRRLVFYLAMEEWVCERLGSGFFLWQVPPTVIFGRNQDMASEVNLDYCRENGIEFYRRRSGGGCVFSDYGNVMISYVCPSSNVELAFDEYLSKLCGALGSVGVSAVRSEHNDVLVQDRKVSGNAFFSHCGRGIVHGTLLYDADFSALEKAITPSDEKLSKHGVKSVRQRVANLRQLGLTMDIESLKKHLISYFTDSQLALSDSDVSEIEEMEKAYLDPSFLFGKDIGNK